jgi:ubiquinone/menaquinone biosynthesis C-methylase UbiE
MPRVSHSEYTKLAKDYDEKHAYKPYMWEAKEIIDRIKERKKTDGKELLDVGCGTGNHLIYLQDEFNCIGIDLHNNMLNIARKKLKKKVKLIQGNMLTFNLKKEFDIIISIYSVVSYSKNYTELKKVLKKFYNHLKKGGVCIIEPYFTIKVYENYSGKNKVEGLLMTEIGKWSKVMREAGFKTKYYYRGLNQSAKGLFILTK